MPSVPVLMAPDWRAGNPYQALLALNLAEQGVDVAFLSGYRRGLPLTRGAESGRILHLHWPDAYFAQHGQWLDRVRVHRFPLDLALATRRSPLVATAHNLYPHNRTGDAAVRRNTRLYYRSARRVITHSQAAAALLQEHFQIPREVCRHVPHGDLSVTLPPLTERDDARARLELGQEKLCLMFGALEPYKGIEPVLTWWRAARPDMQLAIVGRPHTAEYGQHLARLCAGDSSILFRPGWLDDAQLALWLAAADAVLFNYTAILVSGAATLVRSLGIPLLLPQRLRTVEMDEPHPLVHRFEQLETDFQERLRAAMEQPRDMEAARPWRDAHAWHRVAAATKAVYEEVL